MIRNFQFLTLAALALAGGLAGAQKGYPPGTFQLPPTPDLRLEPVALKVSEPFKDQVPADRMFNLPSGFTASVFAASGLERPRLMAFSPDGVLHVADMRGGRTKDSKQGRIVALPDRDADGVADEAIVAADQLSYVNSLAFYKGDLYVAETHQVVRFRDLDGDYVYEESDIFIADLPDIPGNGFHGTRTIVFDEVNEKIYLSVGSPCDLCRQDEPVAGTSEEPLYQSAEWGTVLQFNIDGTGRRVFARGIRNIIGMDLHPVSRQLWGTHNHYDLGRPELPPEWIDIIRADGFYGYPFVYGYQAWVDFSVSPYQKILPIIAQDSLLVQTQRRPVALVPAHLAPIAIPAASILRPFSA
jgi:glucose/arabinose dehydrogenase